MAMIRLKILSIIFGTSILFVPLAAHAQSVNGNNAGIGGLFNMSNGSSFQSTGGQQQSSNAGQGSSNATVLNQNTASTLPIDPSSAPAYSNTTTKNNKYIYLAWLAVGLFVLGIIFLVSGAMPKQSVVGIPEVEEPEPKPKAKTVATEAAETAGTDEKIESEEPKTTPKTPKPKKKSKKKKRTHR